MRKMKTLSTTKAATATLLLAALGALSMLSASAVRVHPSEKDTKGKMGTHLRRAQSAERPLTTPDDHMITALPLLSEIPTQMYAGHLNASASGDKKLFYWLVAPTSQAERESLNVPLLLWLNGGPGCSSMDGFFLENGPLQFIHQNNKWTLAPNPHSWHLAPAWVLYLDQPVGTGLSFTYQNNFCKNDMEVNVDFAYFMEEFLLFYHDIFLNPDLQTPKRPIFMSGESHAGHYIPSMIDYIRKRPNGRVKISFAGAAIGNGWIDPYHQYSAAEVAFGSGLISMMQKANLDDMEEECQEHLRQNVYDSQVCFNLLDTIVDQSYGSQSPLTVSMYDISQFEAKKGKRVYPRGHDVVEAYLGGVHPPKDFQVSHTDVLQALHASESLAANQHYLECTDSPYNALVHQDGLGVVSEIVGLLQANLRLLFYNGIDDLVCNHVRTELALSKLDWEYAKEWSLAPRYVWTIRNNPAAVAYVQEFRNLLFLKIPNSGHMVPLDQPEVALQMITNFIYQKSFQASVQELGSKMPAESTCR